MGWTSAAFAITKNKNTTYSLWALMGDKQDLLIQASFKDMDQIVSPILHNLLVFFNSEELIGEDWGPNWIRVRLHQDSPEIITWERTQFLDAWTSMIKTNHDQLIILLQTLLATWQQIKVEETGQRVNWGEPVIV